MLEKPRVTTSPNGCVVFGGYPCYWETKRKTQKLWDPAPPKKYRDTRINEAALHLETVTFIQRTLKKRELPMYFEAEARHGFKPFACFKGKVPSRIVLGDQQAGGLRTKDLSLRPIHVYCPNVPRRPA